MSQSVKIMGILNITPDSFSDGGAFLMPEAAVDQARRLIDEGADIIDVGGESTRPGAPDVSEQQELDRVMPVVQALRRKFDVMISIDTSKAAVMREATAAGAGMINDVRALREPGALEAARDASVPVSLMHMQGTPRSMQEQPRYKDVVAEVRDFLSERVAACVAAGISRRHLIVDPGFGFGKTLDHNLQLLNRLGDLKSLGAPILVGLSRKSAIGQLLDLPVDQRLYGSLGMAVMAITKGAEYLRVHDVGPTREAVTVAQAVLRA